MTASLDLAASRNVAWAPTIDLYYLGGPLPLTGASVSMQVRLHPGASGAALINLTPALEDIAAPTETQPDRRALRLTFSVPVNVLKAMPTGLNQPEAGEADRYAWDAVITYADARQDKLALGNFILEPGVAAS